MVCSILQFLDASPARLLDDLSADGSDSGFFKSFLLCVLSEEPSVRRLATGVADRLFKGHLEAYRKFDTGRHFGTKELRGELWSRRSVARFVFSSSSLTRHAAPRFCSICASQSHSRRMSRACSSFKNIWKHAFSYSSTFRYVASQCYRLLAVTNQR